MPLGFFQTIPVGDATGKRRHVSVIPAFIEWFIHILSRTSSLASAPMRPQQRSSLGSLLVPRRSASYNSARNESSKTESGLLQNVTERHQFRHLVRMDRDSVLRPPPFRLHFTPHRQFEPAKIQNAVRWTKEQKTQRPSKRCYSKASVRSSKSSTTCGSMTGN